VVLLKKVGIRIRGYFWLVIFLRKIGEKSGFTGHRQWFKHCAMDELIALMAAL
jgi:hypothetical protein